MEEKEHMVFWGIFFFPLSTPSFEIYSVNVEQAEFEQVIQSLASSVGLTVVSCTLSASKPQETLGEMEFFKQSSFSALLQKTVFKKTCFQQTASVLYENSCLISIYMELQVHMVLSKSTEIIATLKTLQWTTVCITAVHTGLMLIVRLSVS